MPAYDINGLTVHFPHEAYPCQVDYMGKVIEGLEGCKNVLLESPTGTGKTLSLLCGVLGWVTQAVKNNEGTQNGPPPTKVFYSSRTHAQLKQVIKEFRRTEYGKVGGDLEVTMTVLGSRDQLCIHPRAEGSSSTSKNAICTSLRQNRKCRFYNKLDEFMEQGGLKKVIDDEVEKNKNKKKQHKVLLDIEDLTSAGQTHGFCPFYYSRKMMSSVSVVFAPYNYLVDPRLRKQIGIDLSDAILIVDEAHNIASNTAEASSFSINTLNITEAVNELSRARVAVTSDTDLPVGEASTRIKDYDLLSGILKKLAHHLEMSLLKAKPSGRNDTPNITSHGSDVITLIKEQTSVTTESLQEFLKVMEACVSDIAKASVASGTKADTPGVEKLSTFLNGVFSLSKESLDESYKMVIFKEKPDKKHVKHNVQPPTQLGVWCMDASVAMRKMMEGCTETDLEKRPPRSLIITSGTLRPLDFFAAELGLDFPVRLQNPHVISESQIMTMAIRQGDNGAALNSKFANRSNPMYIKALGISVAKIVSMVPHGLLVFFQSFTFMNEMMEAWKKPGTYDDSHSIYDIISNRKFIIQEPPQTSLAPTKIQEYCSIIDEGNGAVMFAVFRGKMAEGMDFPDKYARGVALVGIPYANIGELKVTLKMSHLEEKRNRNKGSANGNTIVSGSNWYTLDALRSINQAVGRVIRHSKDYGTVFFLDERYDSKGLQVQLPAWVGHNMVTHTTIDDSFVNNVRGFYNRNGLVFSTVSKGRQHVKPVTKLSHNDGGRKRSLEADKATENAFNHARRYQELRDAQNPGVKKARLEQGIASASVSSFSSTDFKAPVETPPGKSLQIGAVDYASKYTLQEYKKSVKKTLSAEQYDIWKALLVEFAQQIDTASVFMKDRFVPWVVIAFTPKNADLLRCHVVTLPPAIRKEYLQLLKAHLKLVSKG
eukprot:TRINITY_DN5948_c0_g1_i1.p1 TRINITY_DN5948_c0_g1~~TRINITY_DN5948_c0_g1_i1.p1  ORF type:complete len:936 (+),score=200.32 TRINITY_DN5948_c0_g1_i1:1507-4314(+)